jgi:sugar/nucleoside kinase (ribokinase family)
MQTDVIVAGHICLDIIPAFERPVTLEPGKLFKIGPATFVTGGAVSNTGIALHRLGVSTAMMGKVGDDLIGRAIVEYLRSIKPALAGGMIVIPGETSSYSIVISPPRTDRTFLHCTGANDTFAAEDIVYDQLAGAKLFHFGYPTLMRSMYADGGRQMETIFQRVKQLGLMTSLDMSYPDPKSEAAQVDWPAWMERVLPQVDIFLPSLDETQFMLRTHAGPSEISHRLRDWGARIAGVKLGDQGLYVCWPDRELHEPCFAVNVVGTTGSGDATIAGFLAGILHGLPPEEVMTMAVAVGACCCEAADATTGVRPRAEVWQRIKSGWGRLATKVVIR